MAPLWKRSLASWVDTLPYLAFLIVRFRRRDPAMRPWLVASLFANVYEVAASTLFGRTIGQRVCSIRVVSQETGRSPTLKQSLVMWSVLRAPKVVLNFWPESPQLKRSNATMKALKVEIEQLHQKHRGDRDAMNRAILELYEERNVNPLRPILPVLLRLALHLAYGRMLSVSLRRDPLNQGIAGRRAKILVIDERPWSFPRLAELIGRQEPDSSAGRLIDLVPLRKRRAA